MDKSRLIFSHWENVALFLPDQGIVRQVIHMVREMKSELAHAATLDTAVLESRKNQKSKQSLVFFF
jgi:hypothetical protein